MQILPRRYVERLGGIGFCKNAFFALGDQVLGIQGHPEFTKGIMQDILAKPKETMSPQEQETVVTTTNSSPAGSSAF